jgi:tagatose 6-phosphate kinase
VILTVTPNVALDITYQVDRLLPGSSHRVRVVEERAGGKGVNVARVLHALGHDTLVLGFVGGATAAAITGDLAQAGLAQELIAVEGPTRRSVAVVDAGNGEATLFNEPGPPVPAASWGRLEALLAARLPDAEALVVAGSLPPGADGDACARMVRLAAAGRVTVLVDTAGEALVRAAAAGADILKPNADELLASTGRAGIAAGAIELRRRGAKAVVASLGTDGMTAFTPDGSWRAAPPARVAGNPTGAGDAAAAALVAGAVAGTPWPDRLRDAVALSAAAVAQPAAGGFDPALYRRFAHQVLVEEHHAPELDR